MILSRTGLSMRTLQGLMESAVAAPRPAAPAPGAGRIGAGAQRAAAPITAPSREFRQVSDWKPSKAPPAHLTLSRKQVKGHFGTLAAKNPQTERAQEARTHLTHHFFGDVNKPGLAKRLHPHIREVVRRHYGYDSGNDTYDRELTDDHAREAINHLHAGHTQGDGKVVNDLGHVARQLKKGAARRVKRAGDPATTTSRGTASKSHSYDRDDVSAYMARSLDLTLANKRNKTRVAKIARANLGREEERPGSTNTRGIARPGDREGDSLAQKLKARKPGDSGWQGDVGPQGPPASKRGQRAARSRGDEFGRRRSMPHTKPKPMSQPRDTSREDSEDRGKLRGSIKSRLDQHHADSPESHKGPLRTWLDGAKAGHWSAAGGGKGQRNAKSGGGALQTMMDKHGISKGHASGIIKQFKARLAGDSKLELLHKRIPGLRGKVAEWAEMPYDLLESLLQFAYGSYRARTLLVLEQVTGRRVFSEGMASRFSRPEIWKQTDHPDGGYISTTRDYRGAYETAHVHPKHGAKTLHRAQNEDSARANHAKALRRSAQRHG